MDKPLPICLFIDLGGVLFYDEYVELYFLYRIFTLSAKHHSLSVSQFFKQRENLYPQFKNHWIHVWLASFLSQEVTAPIIARSWEDTLNSFNDLFKPYPMAATFLKELSQKFSIYCVANQPKIVEQILVNLGFRSYFKGLLIDTIIGYSKPDPRLFLFALEESGVNAERVLHIGDRLDNDIIPARACGLQALKLTLPAEMVEIPSIPPSFCKWYATSIQQIWHRWEIDSQLDYASFSSYDEVLQSLLI